MYRADTGFFENPFYDAIAGGMVSQWVKWCEFPYKQVIIGCCGAFLRNISGDGIPNLNRKRQMDNVSGFSLTESNGFHLPIEIGKLKPDHIARTYPC